MHVTNNSSNDNSAISRNTGSQSYKLEKAKSDNRNPTKTHEWFINYSGGPTSILVNKECNSYTVKQDERKGLSHPCAGAIVLHVADVNGLKRKPCCFLVID